MKQLDFPVRIIIPPMRPLQNEHHGTNACNDADSRPPLRTGVHRMSLAAPLDAHARSQVPTGLLARLYPHLMGARHGDAMEVLARADRGPWPPRPPFHDRLQGLGAMGR